MLGHLHKGNQTIEMILAHAQPLGWGSGGRRASFPVSITLCDSGALPSRMAPVAENDGSGQSVTHRLAYRQSIFMHHWIEFQATENRSFGEARKTEVVIETTMTRTGGGYRRPSRSGSRRPRNAARRRVLADALHAKPVERRRTGIEIEMLQLAELLQPRP